MKDLMSKEHFSYKIYTLLMESKAYLPFYRQPPRHWLSPTFFHNYTELPHSMIFQKSQPYYKSDKGSHCEDIIESIDAYIYE